MQHLEWISDPKTEGVNRLAPRAYYIPLDAQGNSRARSLNGDWDFAYFDSPLDLPEDVTAVSFGHSIPVPSCWECHGWGQKQYLNVNYPIPFDPPAVPALNPVGVYRRSFTANAAGGRVCLVFEGVSSCMMLYVNGAFAGLTKGSHLQAEFDVTDLCRPGENSLTAVVFTWSSGTYLEDQDAYRYHGIFRDVYLLERAQDHVRDFFIHAETDGSVQVDLDVQGSCTPEMTVASPDGSVLPLSGGKGKVPGVRLWNAENPVLYTLELRTREEIIRVHFGDLDRRLVTQALAAFYWLRELRGIEKKPSTSELVDWLRALIAGGVDPSLITERLPFAGVLLKKDKDLRTLALLHVKFAEGILHMALSENGSCHSSCHRNRAGRRGGALRKSRHRDGRRNGGLECRIQLLLRVKAVEHRLTSALSNSVPGDDAVAAVNWLTVRKQPCAGELYGSGKSVSAAVQLYKICGDLLGRGVQLLPEHIEAFVIGLHQLWSEGADILAPSIASEEFARSSVQPLIRN